MQPHRRKSAFIGGQIFFLALSLQTAPIQAQSLVISQIYGGGGNTGATLKNDFVELFNRTNAPITLDGYKFEYASATGDFNQSTPLTGTIPANSYYLIGESQGTGGTLDLPTPDVAGAIAMSATSARVRILRPDATQLELVTYSGLSNPTAYLRRDSGCSDGFTTGPPAPRNSASPPNVCGFIPPPPETFTISQIQGSGLVSPHLNEYVTTRGIVTQRRSNGFYIESQSADDDRDPATSEGLFVFTRTSPPASAEVNKLVRVTGTVTEFSTVTELTDPLIEPLGDPGAQFVPLPLDSSSLEPASRLDEWERYEGMQRFLIAPRRITGPTGGTINDATANATSNGIAWAVDDNLPDPFAEPAVADGNPERLRLDGIHGFSATGASGSVSGALDFAEGAWSIVTQGGLFFDPSSGHPPPVLPPAPNELSIATFNLRRFFDDHDDPGVADPVLTPEAFERRLTKTALHITNLLRSPDILAVQEADNLNALEQLARKLGASWRAYLQEGNDPSGIDVGFLVNTARVTVQSVTQLEKDNPIHDRPPLLLRATAQGLPINLVTVHQRSLINADTPTVREKRQAQANAIAQIAAGLKSETTIILGDFNALPFDDGNGAMLQPLLDTGYTRLGALLPIEQSYTYIEDGQRQELDHIFVSPPMNTRLSRYEVAHTNAVYPVTDFNLTADPQRASDHDIPLARFHLEPTPPPVRAVGLLNAATLLGGAVSSNELATLFGAGFTANTRITFDNTPAQIFFQSPNQLNFTIPTLPNETTKVQITEGATPIATFELRAQSTTPGFFTQNGTGQGSAAALNQDNTINTPSNPAPLGSIIQLYGTGIDANVSTSLVMGGRVAQRLYTGNAPGLVNGANQVNAIIPRNATPGQAELLLTNSGAATSRRGVHIWIR